MMLSPMLVLLVVDLGDDCVVAALNDVFITAENINNTIIISKKSISKYADY